MTKISKIEQEKTSIGTNINKAFDFITTAEFSKSDSGWRKNFNSSSIAIFILHKNIQEFDIKLLYDLKTKVHRVIVIAIGVAEEYLANLKVRKFTERRFLKFYTYRYRRGLETCPQSKTSKSGHAIFFFPTRPSDEYDSAPSRKYSRPLLDVFACIG